MYGNNGFVILAGQKRWFQSGNSDELVGVTQVGKGKGIKKAPGKNRASARGGPEVIYPTFSRAAELTADHFWKSTFSQMAYDKFPRNFRFHNGLLTYKVKTKSYECHVDMTDPVLAFQTVHNFMQTQAGIFSYADNESKRQEMKEKMQETREEDEIISWSKAKNATQRSILINHYVDRVVAQYNIDSSKRSELNRLIRIGIIADYFNATTIHIENGQISTIDGLIYRAGGGFEIDPGRLAIRSRKASKQPVRESNSMSTRTQIEDDGLNSSDQPTESSQCSGKTVSLYKEWVKFLTQLEKRGSRCRGLPTS